MIVIFAWVICLVASLLGLILRDVRMHGVTLAVSLAMILLIALHYSGVK